MSNQQPETLVRDAQRRLFAQAPAGDYSMVTAKADDKSVAKVQIYGVVGDWWDGLDAATLASQISDSAVDEFEVHLNSPGGVAFDGVAIYNALKNHDAKVTIHVDGYAASAASVIAMAGDEVIMETGSQMMIHNASGLTLGNADEMRYMADFLDKVSLSIADIYAEHTGVPAADWREPMNVETWYNASEAVEAGLADRVGGAKVDDKAAKAAVQFDLSSVFAYAGRQDAPAPVMPQAALHNSPAEPENPNPTMEGADMASDTLISGLRSRLGFAEDVNDDQNILAAVDEALAERAESKPTNKIPEGSVLVDETTLADLQAAAQEGRVARAQQVADHRVAVVDLAVTDGRIPPARKDHWLAQLEADPGAESVLAELKPVIDFEAKGYTGGVDESSDDDSYPAHWKH